MQFVIMSQQTTPNPGSPPAQYTMRREPNAEDRAPDAPRKRYPFAPVNMGNLAPQQLDLYTQATPATPAATFGQPPPPPPPALPQAQQQNQQ